jgi:TP901 family phage tail tape measure protein
VVRATEIVIIAKVQNQASGQLRRLARDIGGMGRANQLATRMQQQNMQLMRQQLRSTGVGSRMRIGQLQQTERMLQLERDLSTNMTHRMSLAQRLAKTTDSEKQLLLSRQIEETHMRDNVLAQRRVVYTEQQVAAERALSAQLKIEEAQYAQMAAQQKELARMARLQRRVGPFQAIGRTTSHIGRAATFAGLLTTAGMAMAGKQFADLQGLSVKAASQIQGINEDVNGIIAGGARLQTEIQKQMMRFTASGSEMADAAYQIYSSMDIGEKQGYRYLAMFNKLAVAMGSDLATATNVGITVLNNFAGAGNNMNKTLDTMATIIRLGRMELGDFDQMMNRVAPAARQAGYSLQDVAGFMELITRKIPSQAQAATAIQRSIQMFSNPAFVKGMQRFGKPITFIDNEGIKRLRAPVEIFKQIIALDRNLGKGGLNLQNLFQIVTQKGRGGGVGLMGTEQGRKGISIGVRNLRELVELQDKSAMSAGEMNKRFKAVQQTFAFKWENFTNQMRVLVLEIGQAAIPVIIRFMGWIKGLIARWKELSPHMRDTIVKFIALMGVVMLIGGPIATVVGAIFSLIGAFITLGEILGVAAGGTGILAELAAFLVFMGEIAAIGAIVITIAVAWHFIKPHLPPWAQRLMSYSGVDLFKDVTKAAGVFETKRGVGLRTGLPVDKGAPFFDPKAKLFPTEKDRQRAKGLWDDLQQARTGLTKDPGDKGLLARIRRDMKEINALGRNKALSKIFDDAAGAIGSTNTAADKFNRKMKSYNTDMKSWLNQRAQAIRQAHDQYQQIIDTAVNNMISKYNELKSANESAFGELFQGPVLTGESFQEAKDWGIKPSAKIINSDLRGQVNAFKKWSGDLNALGKKNVPKALVAELTALGPAAADEVNALRKASPKMLRNFVNLWRQKQRLITQATKQQFAQQLKEWESHGKNMGLKIIAGLETEDSGLAKTMRGILKNSFNGTVLEEVVNEAIKEFQANNPKPKKPVRKHPKATDGQPDKPHTGNPAHDRPHTTTTHVPPHHRRHRHPRTGLPTLPNPGGLPTLPGVPSGYHQQINVTINSASEPTPVAARRAGFIVANQAKRAI